MSQYTRRTNTTIKNLEKQERLERFLPPLVGLAIALFLVMIMNRDYPYVGHDFRYFISRIMDTTFHIRLNGPSIQWYTPSFGGGLPAYSNPQHMEYSFVQWISLLMDPWQAILLTTAVMTFLGYFFFYKFLHETLQFGWMASTLGGLFFTGNGFYIEHMIAGHLGFQLFPLGAIILYFLVSNSHRTLLNASRIALLLTVLVHQAGFTIAIILFLSFLLALPIVHLYRPDLLNFRLIAITSILAACLALAMSASKLSAVAAFMQHFPRHAADVYGVSIGQALIGVAAQLLGVMTLAPLVLIAGRDPELISGGLSALTGASYGIWELDCSLSPVLVFFLLTGLMEFIANLRKYRNILFPRDRIPPLLLLAALVWIVLELTLAKGIVYSLTKQLPVLESLHVNARYTAVFILPLAIVGAFQANRFFSSGRSLRSFTIFCTLAGLSLLTYYSLNPDVHSRHLDVRTAGRIQDQLRAGNILPVRQITDVGDLDGFLHYSSVYRPYEALFGYSLETFAPEIQPGSVYGIENGYFNMTNPASLVFPGLNDTRPFERISETERDKLEIFLRRGQPDWLIPTYQRMLDIISVISVAICLGLLGWLSAWEVRANREGKQTPDGRH